MPPHNSRLLTKPKEHVRENPYESAECAAIATRASLVMCAMPQGAGPAHDLPLPKAPDRAEPDAMIVQLYRTERLPILELAARTGASVTHAEPVIVALERRQAVRPALRLTAAIAYLRVNPHARPERVAVDTPCGSRSHAQHATAWASACRRPHVDG